MNRLTKEKAEIILKEAEAKNKGPWVSHSMYVGQAAKLIAENCEDLDSEKAFVLGILHDIGRRVGFSGMRHSIDGHNYAISQGYETVARICITHSFPTGKIQEAFGKWDCSDEEYNFVDNFLKNTVYDDYDKLIQLCDTLALPEGFTLMEKRMIDVALRHGVHEHTVSKWKATYEIKEYFEKKMGKSIYSILPGVIENTFMFK